MNEIIQRAKALSTEQLEELIGELADLRATLYPQVTHSRPDPASGKTPAIQDDAEMILKGVRSGGVRFWFRSFGYGWLGFGISEQNSLTLRDQLNALYPNQNGKLIGVGDGSRDTPH